LVDETYVKVAGRWPYLYRAVDQYGQVIDVLLSQPRAKTGPAEDQVIGWSEASECSSEADHYEPGREAGE
jgi:hypothetical protein